MLEQPRVDIPAPRSGALRPVSPRARLAVLDVSRALALLGVFTGNVALICLSAEDAGARPQGTLTTLVDAANSLLLLGKARALLSMLFGAGVVLLWHSATRQGQSPHLFLLRRFVVLFAIGSGHFLLFPGDILTEYALSGVLLIPLLPWLLGGARWRPFVLTGVCTVLSGFTDQLGMAGLPFQVSEAVTSTLAACAVGVWLARQPELRGEGSARRSSLRMALSGLVVAVMGAVAFAALPNEPVARVPGLQQPVWAVISRSVTGALMLIGGAACYLRVVWLLLERQRRAGRALHALAPLGRVTLSAYLGSTLIFLTVLAPFEGQVPLVVEYAFALALFCLFAIAARYYLTRFTYGPAEWVWRRLTYGCALPMRRPATAHHLSTRAR